MMINDVSPQNNKAEEAVLKALVFFDLFSYPLTDWEIWQGVSFNLDFLSLKKIIEKLLLENKIETLEGFYFLPGKQEIVRIRKDRYNYTNAKIKLARSAVRFFSWLPSVKLVAVSNLIGHHNLRAESDIDIFIITSSGRLWLSRLFCTGIMKLLNRRPNKKTKKDKICLSFYVSVSGLDLGNLRFKNGDPYFDYWLLGLFPLCDKDDYLNYFRSKNLWLKEAFPNCLLFKNGVSIPGSPISLFEKSFFFLGDQLEKLARKIQLFILPKKLKELANQNSGVVLSDSVLRFYLNDRRQEFLDKYKKRLAEIGIYD